MKVFRDENIVKISEEELVLTERATSSAIIERRLKTLELKMELIKKEMDSLSSSLKEVVKLEKEIQAEFEAEFEAETAEEDEAPKEEEKK